MKGDGQAWICIYIYFIFPFLDFDSHETLDMYVFRSTLRLSNDTSFCEHRQVQIASLNLVQRYPVNSMNLFLFFFKIFFGSIFHDFPFKTGKETPSNLDGEWGFNVINASH